MAMRLDRETVRVTCASRPAAGTGRRAWSVIALTLLLTPLVVVAATWAAGGVPSTELQGLPGPGVVTTWGIRIAQSLRDLAAALTVGLLVLAATCATGRSASNPGAVDGARAVLLAPVAVAAAGWSVACLALLALLWSDAAGWPLLTPGALEQVAYFALQFELSLRSHTAHVAMVIHFVVAGYLFASGLIGIDSGISRPAFPYRVLILMVTFGAHAFYSVSLMASTTILAEDWFASLGRDWGASLERDQYTGASIGWASGDYPLLIIGVALIVQWFRHDLREQRQVDRRADRDGDATLASYNAYLAELADPRDGLTTGARLSILDGDRTCRKARLAPVVVPHPGRADPAP